MTELKIPQAATKDLEQTNQYMLKVKQNEMTRRSSTHTEAAVEMPALAHTLGTALPTLCFEHLNLSRATVRFICGRHVASWDRISTLRLSLTLYTALHLRSHPELAPKTLLSVGRATP